MPKENKQKEKPWVKASRQEVADRKNHPGSITPQPKQKVSKTIEQRPSQPETVVQRVPKSFDTLEATAPSSQPETVMQREPKDMTAQPEQPWMADFMGPRTGKQSPDVGFDPFEATAPSSQPKTVVQRESKSILEDDLNALTVVPQIENAVKHFQSEYGKGDKNKAIDTLAESVVSIMAANGIVPKDKAQKEQLTADLKKRMHKDAAYPKLSFSDTQLCHTSILCKGIADFCKSHGITKIGNALEKLGNKLATGISDQGQRTIANHKKMHALVQGEAHISLEGIKNMVKPATDGHTSKKPQAQQKGPNHPDRS